MWGAHTVYTLGSKQKYKTDSEYIVLGVWG